MSAERIVVIGGGLAGITAALQLADAGRQVTLLEAKPRLGGLTASFRRDDIDVDTGQHVFMRCCTSYRNLLDRLGVTAQTTLQSRLDVPVVRVTDGRRGRISRNGLPVAAGLPLHLGQSLLSYSLLTSRERISAARAALALKTVDPADPATDARSFGDWLAEHGQGAGPISALWDLVGVATLNAPAAQASLSLAAKVFQLGLLTEAGAADIGWSDVPLQQLHGEAAIRAFDRAGVECKVGTKARSLRDTSDGWSVITDASVLTADGVVIATEPPVAEALLPTGAAGVEGWSERLGASPIVNVHARFDRSVMTGGFLACVGSPLQWIFDRSGAAGSPDGEQYIAASLSAATDVVDTPVGELRDRLVPEFARALPAARDAKLLDFFVTRERTATFRQAPGSAAYRPATATSLPGVVMAGAYVATGWPATMESAVRSGEAAATALLTRRAVRGREESAA